MLARQHDEEYWSPLRCSTHRQPRYPHFSLEKSWPREQDHTTPLQHRSVDSPLTSSFEVQRGQQQQKQVEVVGLSIGLSTVRNTIPQGPHSSSRVPSPVQCFPKKQLIIFLQPHKKYPSLPSFSSDIILLFVGRLFETFSECSLWTVASVVIEIVRAKRSLNVILSIYFSTMMMWWKNHFWQGHIYK